MSKIVLVTGATSGMGKTTAVHLASLGYTVYAGYRDPAAASALFIEAEAKGLNIRPIPVDVTDTNSVGEAIDSLLHRSGRLDALVNNAGFGVVSTVEHFTDDEMVRQFDVNVFGVLRMCRAALPAMRLQKSGVIVNVSSFLGRMGFPLLTLYNASKYAVEGITDSLRLEVGRLGIRVYSVVPGLFGTDFVKRGLKVNDATVSDHSPYKALVDRLVPMVADKINNGPDPIIVAEAVERAIRDDVSPIRILVGDEAVTFVPMAKSMEDGAFEKKVQNLFEI